MLSSIYGKKEIDVTEYRTEIDVNIGSNVIVFIIIVIIVVVIVDNMLLAVV